MLPNHHPLVATATAIAAACHSPPSQSWSLRGVIDVVSSLSLPSPLSPPPSYVIYLIVAFVLSLCPLPSSSGGGHLAHRIRHHHRCCHCCCRLRRRRRGRLRHLLPPPPRDLFDCCVHVHCHLLMLSPRSLALVAQS